MPLDLARFSGLVGFGDSTVDSGNADAALFGLLLPSSDGWWNGRFSSGPNYLDLLYEAITGSAAQSFEASVQLSGAEGDLGANYAVGGSTALGDELSVQLGSFAADLQGGLVLDASPVADTLFALNIGGNDALDFLGANGTGYAAEAAAAFGADLAGALGDLIGAVTGLGGENFLLSLLPNIGITPDVANGEFAATSPPRSRRCSR